jgi:hypothetical protein
VLDWLNKVVAMLAEIFMLRSEAAARLQEQTTSTSSSVFVLVPFTPSDQFVFKEGAAHPTHRHREVGNEQVA